VSKYTPGAQSSSDTRRVCIFDARLHHNKFRIKSSQFLDLENLINVKRYTQQEKLRVNEFMRSMQIRQSFQVQNPLDFNQNPFAEE
jgi:hypothetical protein